MATPGAPSEYRIRPATVSDAAAITRHRVEMFRDMGLVEEADAAALAAASLAYFVDTLPRGTYLGWVVEHAGVIIAGAGLLVHRGLPRPDSLDAGDEGYLLNVYTEPEHRRRGLGRRLTELILAWCREHGIARIALHASEEGRALYASLGFVAIPNEMRLVMAR